jgi:glycosyltransferase involved in cell wall biosynthesis
MSASADARHTKSIAIVAASPRIVGGQSVQATLLTRALVSDGYDVAFVPIDPVPPRGLRWTRRVRYLRTVVTQALYWPGLLRAARADVVHVFSASYLSFLLAPMPAMLVALAAGRRIVLHYHSGEAGDHLARWGWLIHPWLRLPHEIVVPSEFLREVFDAHGHRVTVIANLIDRSPFQFRERSPLRPRLLSVRSLERPYAVDAVIEAFALVKARRPDATLTIAGSGSQERALKHLVASLGLRDVEFVGAVGPDDMPALYARADIFVNAAQVDNQPVSVLEAFASGVPVISTAVGDIPALLRDGETGRLVPDANPARLAAAVLELLDPACPVTDMTTRAAALLERHTWPAVREAWQDVYTRADRPGRRAESVTS